MEVPALVVVRIVGWETAAVARGIGTLALVNAGTQIHASRTETMMITAEEAKEAEEISTLVNASLSLSSALVNSALTL